MVGVSFTKEFCEAKEIFDSLDIYPVMDVLKDFPDSKYIFNLIKKRN